MYSWFQIALDASALAQSGHNTQSVIAGKDLEIEGAIENTKHQMTRQFVTNGDGIVAAAATTASNTVIGLTNAAARRARTYGYSALVRGWLFPGMPVDVGTTVDTDVLATGAVIQAVDYSNPAAPTVTMPSAIATTAGTHFFYIPNPNSATAPNPELNGLRQIIGTGALGGLNPATAGQEYWRGAFRDTTTTTFSLDLPLNLQRYVLQTSNQPGSSVWTVYRQQANFYACCRTRSSSPATRTSPPATSKGRSGTA